MLNKININRYAHSVVPRISGCRFRLQLKKTDWQSTVDMEKFLEVDLVYIHHPPNTVCLLDSFACHINHLFQ